MEVKERRRVRRLARDLRRLPRLNRAAFPEEPEETDEVLGRALRPMGRDLALGDRVEVWPALMQDRCPGSRIGTVCWIHPKRRYYLVEFDSGGRESFPWGFAE